MSSLSPLTIAALLASLAAHASVAMYLAGHDAGATGPAAEVATAIDVETIALPEETPPLVSPNTVPPPSPRAPTPAPPAADPAHVHSATLRPAPAETAPAAAASTLTAADDAAPTFSMVLGTAATAPGGSTRAGGADHYAAPEAPLPADGVDQLARLVSGPPPAYPSSARDSSIEADVPLDIVVDEAGHVIDVRATQHLGYGLDESAAAAIRGYRFAPAMRGGRAVKVRMRWTVVFRLS